MEIPSKSAHPECNKNGCALLNGYPWAPKLDRINDAVSGRLGDDARRIAETAIQITDTLLRKNHDYGGSAWTPPMLAPGMTSRQAIQCRMSDKIARLVKLLSGDLPLVDESIEDTMRDLAGYSTLWLGAPDESGK